ncbi:MAG: hypothetical protein ACYC92_08290 [Candidatus Acidiferrales bacterium]
MMRRIAIPAAIVLLTTAALAQRAQFGITKSELGTAQLATITYGISSDSLKATGVNFLTWSCSSGSCLFFDVPQTGLSTRHTAIFSVGDWRIAAYCESSNGYELQFHPCIFRKNAAKAWIELHGNGDGLSVLFPGKKPPKDLEKTMNSHWTNSVSLYYIISVHNVRTNETWPKQLNELMKK